MELHGEVVKHKVFGRGHIVGVVNNKVIVLFDMNKLEKKFTYPSAFGKYLELENTSFLEEIEKDKNLIAQKATEIKRVNEERAIKFHKDRRTVGKSSGKTLVRNNIAFKCIYCDGGKSKDVVGYKRVCSDDIIKYNIKVKKHVWCSQTENMCNKYLNGKITREELCEFYNKTKYEFSKSVCYESQMLEIWNAGAGITQNGDKRGKPMSLRNVIANSLSLLTSKLPNSEEKDRFIFAVFLIDENYEGDNSEEGYVVANAKYRIQLSLEEAKKLKFWDYYFNDKNPEKIFLGSGLHRYITDDQSTQVLKKICEIKKGTSEEMISKEFLEYYCRIKNVDINSIPLPKGALLKNR